MKNAYKRHRIDEQFAKICKWLKENQAIMRTDIKGGTTVLSKRPPLPKEKSGE